MTKFSSPSWTSRFSGILVATAAMSFVSLSATSAAEKLTGQSLTSLLRDGGHVIYIRHASTEKDYADQVTADPNNCSTQRALSEKGWQEAELIGSSFNILRIPVGVVHSSEYCRVWQTAKIAFGSYRKTAKLNFEPAEEYTKEQIELMRNRVEPMLREKPVNGTNTVIVGHDDPFEAVTGIYPEPQGVAYVIKPKTDGFDVVGWVGPSDWPKIIADSN